jgi:DNA-binding transcriptional MerR regulator
MKMQQQQFRIGTLAQELDVPKFVIRFWEKEFDIKSSRTDGGQRYYTAQDLTTFKQIKELLYIKKFTIAGAKDALQTRVHVPSASVVGSTKTTMHNPAMLQLSKDPLLQLLEKLYKLQRIL